MGRVLLMYGAIHANVLLVSLFLMGWIDGIGLIVLQVAFLTFLLWFWKHYGMPKRNMSWIERSLAFREPWRDGEYSSCHECHAFRN